MPKQITLVNGGVTTVDDDYEWLNQYEWRAISQSRYVARSEWNKETKKPTLTYMHRQIANPPDGVTVDHEDRDGFNNQRSNLRWATVSQNQRNRSRQGRSRFRGVTCFHHYFTSRFRHDGKVMHIGYFHDEIVAARAYDAYVRVYGDEFDCLNLPSDPPLSIAEVEQIKLQQHRSNPAKEKKTSPYRGVSWFPRRRRWRAAITKVGNRQTLGYFKDPVEGARAYDAAARELYGHHAKTNFS